MRQETVVKKFNKTEAKVAKVEETLSAITIKSQDDSDAAIVKLKDANSVKKSIEDDRKAIIKPAQEFVATVNGLAKNLTGRIEIAISSVKNRMLTFQNEEKERYIRARTEQRIEQLKSIRFKQDGSKFHHLDTGDNISQLFIETLSDEQWSRVINEFTENINKLNEENAEVEALLAGTEVVTSTVTVKPVITQEVKKVSGTTKRWVFDITNVSQVPREYLMVDEVKIRKAVAAGVRLIPGVNIYQQESISIR